MSFNPPPDSKKVVYGSNSTELERRTKQHEKMGYIRIGKPHVSHGIYRSTHAQVMKFIGREKP